LKSHDGAAEETDHQNNGDGSDADDIHLLENVVGVVGAAEDIPEGPPAEEDEVLKRFDKGL
jgi:hypothetical protein